jgi:hypothetical protein
MDGYDMAGVGLAMSTDAPTRRKNAFKPAEPLEEHTIASIAFLKRVNLIQLTGGDKKNFEFTVSLNPDPQDETSHAASFTITRTYQEIDRTSKIVQDACCRHYQFNDVYNVPVCQLCEPFKAKVELPVSSKDRLLHSKEKIQKIMGERVVALVRGAIVPPTNEKLYCEGVTRFPAAVAKLLLLGVDQTKL